jgi:hypothetical protein
VSYFLGGVTRLNFYLEKISAFFGIFSRELKLQLKSHIIFQIEAFNLASYKYLRDDYKGHINFFLSVSSIINVDINSY